MNSYIVAILLCSAFSAGVAVGTFIVQYKVHAFLIEVQQELSHIRSVRSYLESAAFQKKSLYAANVCTCGRTGALIHSDSCALAATN